MSEALKTSSSQQVMDRIDRRLTATEFQGLADVPPELEWFANIDNPRTRKAYRGDLEAFSRFVSISQPEEFRQVTRAHVLAWRKDLENRPWRRRPSAASWQLSRRCSTTCVSRTPSRTIRSML